MSLKGICLSCGGSVREELRDETHQVSYEGRMYEVTCPTLSLVCDTCHEVTVDGRAFSAVRRALRAELGLLQPDKIRAVRGRYTQTQAAQLTGIAPETWSRLENDRVLHSRSTDRLLRAFMTNPRMFESYVTSTGQISDGVMEHPRTISSQQVRSEPGKTPDRAPEQYALAA